MENIMQQQIFFFISSVGFIILGSLSVAILVYVLILLKSFTKILIKIEKNIDNISNSAVDILEDLQGSIIYRLFFKKKKKRINK